MEVFLRKLMVGTVMSLIIITGAAAADVPGAAGPPAQVPWPSGPPVWNWAGFYIGAYLGGAGSQSVSTPDPTCQNVVTGICPSVGIPYGGTLPAQYTLGSSVIAGGTAGYNWQLGSGIFGLESEFGRIHSSGAAPFTVLLNGTSVPSPGAIANERAFSTLGNWYATFAARAGFTVNHLFGAPALLYVKGGAAVTRFNTGFSTLNTPPFVFDLINASATETIWGAVAGGGIEWALGRNWSVKGEYEFLGFHHATKACANSTTAAGALDGAIYCTSTAVDGIHTGKVGLNYRFDWGGGPKY
jgi:outer membrane immunogenic protein